MSNRSAFATLRGMRSWTNLGNASLSAFIIIVAACSSGDGGSSNNSALEGGVGNGGFVGNGGGSGTLCGNGVLDLGEMCDGTTTETCATATMGSRPNGVARCSQSCTVDVSGCTGASSGGGAPGGTTGAGGAQSNGGAPPIGGTVGAGGTTPASGGTPGAGGGSSSDFAQLRQACVDAINQYRSTVGAPPLTLAPEDVELCSDQGAQQDATAGVAHGSAGNCPGMNAQDTCPGWDPTRYGGEQQALLQCLSQMWAEGPPPVPVNQCIADRQGCFQDHGHYINMSNPSSGVVSCGFYRMPNGDLWMNQDFGR